MGEDHQHAHPGHEHHGHHHHGPGGHHHDVSDVGDRALGFTIALNVALTVVEVVVGVFAGSLALIADAVHNLGDAAALLVALIARRIGRRGVDDRFTFGYRRAELIGALVNLTSLLILGLFLVVEAVERALEPQPIATGWVMGAAAAAVVVDLGTAAFLWRFSKGNMNFRAAFLHNLTDAATSVLVIVGAALVAVTGSTLVDPLLTLLIAAGILWSSVGMLRSTAHILMEGTPPGLELEALIARLTAVQDVLRVHHVHAWQLDETHRAVEAHVELDEHVVGEALEVARQELRRVLREDFEVEHATLEFEWPDTDCADHGPGGAECQQELAAAG